MPKAKKPVSDPKPGTRRPRKKTEEKFSEENNQKLREVKAKVEAEDRTPKKTPPKPTTPAPGLPPVIKIEPDNLTLAREYLVKARDEVKTPGHDCSEMRSRIDVLIMCLDELYQDIENAAEEKMLLAEA